jgi:hypothetical protein
MKNWEGWTHFTSSSFVLLSASQTKSNENTQNYKSVLCLCRSEAMSVKLKEEHRLIVQDKTVEKNI